MIREDSNDLLFHVVSLFKLSAARKIAPEEYFVLGDGQEAHWEVTKGSHSRCKTLQIICFQTPDQLTEFIPSSECGYWDTENYKKLLINTPLKIKCC